MPDLWARLDVLAREHEFSAIEELAAGALEGADAERQADLWRYIAWARFELDDLEGAVEAAQFANDDLLEAKAHFHLWRFEKARQALARVDDESGLELEDAAEAVWYAALLEEFAGNDPDPYYARAAALAPALFPMPVRLRDAEVDAVIQEALDALPPAVADALSDAVVTVVPLPARHPDVDPLSLGLYVGTDRMQRSIEDGPTLPPRIEVYRRNVERIAADRAEAVHELRTTLLHEIGHHLGFDEEGVAHLGLE